MKYSMSKPKGNKRDNKLKIDIRGRTAYRLKQDIILIMIKWKHQKY